ncbi:hypothetical protein ACP4OV_015777 [Aristida adscensionis]
MAISDCDRAIALDNSFSKAYLQKGIFCMKLKNYREAEDIMSSAAKVFIIYDNDMNTHRPKIREPENAKRIPAIIDRLAKDRLLERCQVMSVAPTVDEEHVLAVHSAEYYDFIKRLPMKGSELHPYREYFVPPLDSSGGTPMAASKAARAVVEACRQVATGCAETAFAIVRPPGHHAMRSIASGFCFLNDIAIGARYLQQVQRLNKILIVDFDVHHGDGTQDIFYNDRSVFSPYTEESNKLAEAIGDEEGQGFNINLCLNHDITSDDMLLVFDYLFLPVAKQFSPDFVLVSAGLDAAKGDKLGKCLVDPSCYEDVVLRLKNLLPGKMVLALEGGYDYRSSLPASCAACVKALLCDGAEIRKPTYGKANSKTWKEIAEVRTNLSGFWSILSEEMQKPSKVDPNPTKDQLPPDKA